MTQLLALVSIFAAAWLSPVALLFLGIVADDCTCL